MAGTEAEKRQSPLKPMNAWLLGGAFVGRMCPGRANSSRLQTHVRQLDSRVWVVA